MRKRSTSVKGRTAVRCGGGGGGGDGGGGSAVARNRYAGGETARRRLHGQTCASFPSRLRRGLCRAPYGQPRRGRRRHRRRRHRRSFFGLRRAFASETAGEKLNRKGEGARHPVRRVDGDGASVDGDEKFGRIRSSARTDEGQLSFRRGVISAHVLGPRVSSPSPIRCTECAVRSVQCAASADAYGQYGRRPADAHPHPDDESAATSAHRTRRKHILAQNQTLSRRASPADGPKTLGRHAADCALLVPVFRATRSGSQVLPPGRGHSA